ncbi:MAG: hypothetical protein WBW84_12290 [Acidobacteriaceae bacterium]
MSEPEAGTEEIQCSEIVYRALKKAVPPGESIPAEAFMRRVRPLGSHPPTEDAVSLSRKKYATAKECRSKLNRMRGTASLHVGRVRDLPLQLEVRPDPVRGEDGDVVEPDHSLLMNLPDPVTDIHSAETAASDLIRIARFVTPEEEEEEHRARRTQLT